MINTLPAEDDTQTTRGIIDILFRLTIILALVFFSWRIVFPFPGAVAWGAILAVALYPVFVRVSDRAGGRRKLMGTLFILISIALIMVPCFLLVILMGAIGGMIAAGIIGLFIGAVILAVTSKHFMTSLESARSGEMQPAEAKT
jgi:predicted PurR-regulated permease PerM